MRRSTPLVLLLAVYGALTACDLPGSHHEAASDQDLNTRAALPLTRYDLDHDERKLLHEARWDLGRKCMAGLGFSGFAAFAPPADDPVRPDAPGAIRLSSVDLDLGDKPYGIDDPRQGAKTGYHSPSPETQDRKWPMDQYLALTGDFRHGDSRRAHGHRIPEGGCLGQADRRVYGSVPERATFAGIRFKGYELTVMRLMRQANGQAAKDPAHRRADKAWSSCMKKEGFSFKDPKDAQYQADWFAAEEASRKERRTAEADADCKRSTGYVKAVHEVDVRIEKRLIAKNRTLLDGVTRRNRTAVRNARAVIDGQS
ncbi:hypothetical protein [Streptomyces sp. NPDC001348]